MFEGFIDLKKDALSLHLNEHFKKRAHLQYIQKPRPLLFAKVEDALLHYLYQTLQSEYPQLKLPPYFQESERHAPIGAHITVAYGEDMGNRLPPNIPFHFFFTYGRILKARLHKTYYLVEIQSEAISKIRKDLNLPMPIQYKGHAILPHVTFGIEE